MNPALRISIAFIACLFWALPGKSQVNLYSDYSRLQYAVHLESTGDFGEAAGEWQGLYRISRNDSHLLSAARAWRLDRHPARALALLDSALAGSDLIRQTELFNAERRYNETLLGRYTTDPLEPAEDTTIRQLLALMIAGRAWQAEAYYLAHQAAIDANSDLGLQLLNTELVQRKKHSKFLAGLLGAVLPGSGKLYSGHAVDAFQAFMAVGLNGVMALVAYRDLGSRSFWPWFFGGMGAGFYLGNIVGSVNTVKRDEALFNKQISAHAYGYYHTRLLAD